MWMEVNAFVVRAKSLVIPDLMKLDLLEELEHYFGDANLGTSM